ncbi:MAG: DUF2953 domain-containing protein [Oscillospiraceae bacterium]|nr:DUF2953 domain-containing protein [Oscillospiraceae bacterium]
MGWLIALGIIVLLAIMPLGVSVRYNADGPYVGLILGFYKLQIIPKAKKTDKKEKPKKKAQSKQTTPQAQTPASSEKGGSITDFLPLLRLVFDLLIDFRRKLRVRTLEMKVTLAGGDPCDLAVNYGRAWAALGNLEPQLDRFFIIQKKDMQVQCDFEADKTVIAARLDLTITLGRLLRLLTCYGFRGIREYLKIMKLRKGGAVK